MEEIEGTIADPNTPAGMLAQLRTGRQIVRYESTQSAFNGESTADEARRRHVVDELSSAVHHYSEEEDALIARGEKTINDTLSNDKKKIVSKDEGLSK
jgi:hypothetical protein